jgi:hypothetical protein
VFSAVFMRDESGRDNVTARAVLLAILALVMASPAAGAPIYGDVSLENGIHLWSDDVFIARGYWAKEVTEEEVLSHPFDLDVKLDGGRYRVDVAFPSILDTCGTFQVDAWWHGGWWGELRPTTQSCDNSFSFPDLSPEYSLDPPLTIDPRGGDDEEPGLQVVPEPASWLLVASGAAFCAQRARKFRLV